MIVYWIDVDEKAKHAAARELFARRDTTFVVSTQVLQEFYAAATGKLRRKFAADQAEAVVRGLADLALVQVDLGIILDAIRATREHQLSFWDALIVQAALRGGCRRLITEDLQDGRRFGELVVENPFRHLK